MNYTQYLRTHQFIWYLDSNNNTNELKLTLTIIAGFSASFHLDAMVRVTPYTRRINHRYIYTQKIGQQIFDCTKLFKKTLLIGLINIGFTYQSQLSNKFATSQTSLIAKPILVTLVWCDVLRRWTKIIMIRILSRVGRCRIIGAKIQKKVYSCDQYNTWGQNRAPTVDCIGPERAEN